MKKVVPLHQMRVAYRRDSIKLRNHPMNKAVGRTPMAFIFLTHNRKHINYTKMRNANLYN